MVLVYGTVVSMDVAREVTAVSVIVVLVRVVGARVAFIVVLVCVVVSRFVLVVVIACVVGSAFVLVVVIACAVGSRVVLAVVLFRVVGTRVGSCAAVLVLRKHSPQPLHLFHVHFSAHVLR